MLKHARRVLVVGCSGGGKSTLSQEIARRLGLVYMSIDRDIRWLAGWVVRDRQEQRSIIETLVAQERWVMDGTNTSTFDIRVPPSDLVIWVRMPRLVNVWGILSRWVRHRGRTRPEMAPGCPEKMDWEFFEFVWTFENKISPQIVEGLQRHAAGKPVLVLKSRREMRNLLDLVGSAS